MHSHFETKPTVCVRGQQLYFHVCSTNVNAWSLLNSTGTWIGTGALHENTGILPHTPVVVSASK
jgi:hypothetical protein